MIAKEYYGLAFTSWRSNTVYVKKRIDFDESKITKPCPKLDEYKVRWLCGTGTIPSNSNAKTDNRKPNIQVINDPYSNIIKEYHRPLFFVSKAELVAFLQSDYFWDKCNYYQMTRYVIDMTSFIQLSDDDMIECGDFLVYVHIHDTRYRASNFFKEEWLKYIEEYDTADYTGKYGHFLNINRAYDDSIPVVDYDDFINSVTVKNTEIECTSIETIDKYIEMLESSDEGVYNIGLNSLLSIDINRFYPYIAYANYITGCVSSSQVNMAKFLKKKYPALVNAVKTKITWYDEGNHQKMWPACQMMKTFEEFGWDKVPEDLLQRMDAEFDDCFKGLLTHLGNGGATMFIARFNDRHNFK